MKSTARDVRARLHDVNLPAHEDPFDVLFLAAEDALDERSSMREPPHRFVIQDDALARDRNLFDAAFVIEREQAVFSRARQHAHRLRDGAVNKLLRDLLPSVPPDEI